MNINRITGGLSVSPQIAAKDMQEIAALGFRSIICNRPDGESAGQPSHAEIEAAAGKAGLGFRYQPVASPMVRNDQVTAFADALEELPGPVLAYCRSGARSTMLWQMVEKRRSRAADGAGQGKGWTSVLSTLLGARKA
jgi:sulfide:quinone oxidoreductase